VPIVNGLEQQFADQIDFIHLNIDIPAERDAASSLNMTRRSTYYLLDASGNVLNTWIGPLPSEQAAQAFAAALAAP
jgi:hypothetical protein